MVVLHALAGGGASKAYMRQGTGTGPHVKPDLSSPPRKQRRCDFGSDALVRVSAADSGRLAKPELGLVKAEGAGLSCFYPDSGSDSDMDAADWEIKRVAQLDSDAAGYGGYIGDSGWRQRAGRPRPRQRSLYDGLPARGIMLGERVRAAVALPGQDADAAAIAATLAEIKAEKEAARAQKGAAAVAAARELKARPAVLAACVLHARGCRLKTDIMM